MSAVQLCEISLDYGRGCVLQNIDLRVNEGEYVVVLGASGCGKTSLLRLVAGLVRPTGGKILIANQDVVQIPPRHRDVALVPQQAGVYPHVSIGKSIEMGIPGRVSKAERQKRVIEAAKTVELDGLLDRRPDQLSGGQLRRAAVAKAIARQAAVRLLDEPLSAIDANLRFQIESDLRRLHDLTPGVSIHVTHDGAEAMRLADRIAVIENGRISQFDEPNMLVKKPSTPGVAAMLGQSRLITASVKYDGTDWRQADGHAIEGPHAERDKTATIGFYQADLQHPDSMHGESGEWITVAKDGCVSRDKVFWFID